MYITPKKKGFGLGQLCFLKVAFPIVPLSLLPMPTLFLREGFQLDLNLTPIQMKEA